MGRNEVIGTLKEKVGLAEWPLGQETCREGHFEAAFHVELWKRS